MIRGIFSVGKSGHLRPTKNGAMPTSFLLLLQNQCFVIGLPKWADQSLRKRVFERQSTRRNSGVDIIERRIDSCILILYPLPTNEIKKV
jgi:hypothetical protein